MGSQFLNNTSKKLLQARLILRTEYCKCHSNEINSIAIANTFIVHPFYLFISLYHLITIKVFVPSSTSYATPCWICHITVERCNHTLIMFLRPLWSVDRQEDIFLSLQFFQLISKWEVWLQPDPGKKQALIRIRT